ncbi:MAG: 3-isopropylmalate dehydratase [Euryarchaeota archaeon]|nr:3-isopropylmalate dehydratase [Euryarchaeota archaeon]
MQTVFEGKAWPLLRDGKLIDDIDTDMIYHNSHLAITDIKQMGQYALGNLKGYESFAKEAKPGDIVVAGQNFGSGSSRQQAIDCFKSLGIGCVLVMSIGAISKRNAINSGYPLFIVEQIDLGALKTGDTIRVDIDKLEITKAGQKVGSLAPISKVQRDILEAGNVFEYAKKL